jgi:hypothetical protein
MPPGFPASERWLNDLAAMSVKEAKARFGERVGCANSIRVTFRMLGLPNLQAKPS